MWLTTFWHRLHPPPLVSSSGWRSSQLSSSWIAWIYGTGSSQSRPPAAADQSALPTQFRSLYESNWKTAKDTGTQTAEWPTCLTAMLTLTELMEPSIRTFSFSFRLMITGWRSNSLLLLEIRKNIQFIFSKGKTQVSWTAQLSSLSSQWRTVLPPLACCVSPPLVRRSSPGRGQPAGWHAPRWGMGVRLLSEGGQPESVTCSWWTIFKCTLFEWAST